MPVPSPSTDRRDRRKVALAAIQREQILEGFASAIVTKGYAKTTITDIVAAAHVSKTTFYELFDDKEAVFLALHTAVAEAMLTATARARAATKGEPDWRERMRRIATSYLEGMADNPAFLLQVIAEAAATSAATRRARNDAFERFARELTGLAHELARVHDDVQPLSHDLAIAALAGILELVNRAAPEGPAAVRALAPAAAEVLIRLLQAPDDFRKR